MTTQRKIKRSISFNEISNFKPNLLNFEGAWLESIGRPELTGAWLIWGNTGNGKTRLALQLARYLTNFGKVAYNSLEEGLTASMQRAIVDVGIANVAQRFVLLDRESIDDLRIRLGKRGAPDIIFIDSVQYTQMTQPQYNSLVNEFRNKLFVFISHADGEFPKGALANFIYYDANVHIQTKGFKGIISKSRYGGGADYIVWDKGYREFWKI